ncbi:MAG: hypothetical protein ABH808_04015 [Candidatus Kuenenbacteria bacterium]
MKLKLFKKNHLSIIIFSAIVFLSFTFNVQAAEKKIHYQAILVKQNFSTLEIEANKEISFEVKFKNKGSVTWRNDGKNYLALNTTDLSERESVFAHSSWPYFYQSAKMQEKKVKPNEIGTFKFILRAPNLFESKKYVEKFRLVVNDLTLVEGKGVVTISINVKGIPKPKPEEEIKRINLFYKTKPEDEEIKQKIKIFSNEKYEIKDKDGNLLASQLAGSESEVEFNFKTKKYFLNINGQRILGTDSFFRFYPNKGPEGILEITNFDNSYHQSTENINFTKFQGTLETKYNPETEQLLIINEVQEKYYLNYFKKADVFNPNELISDSAFTNYNSMTLNEIQSFLETNKSYLANYVIPSEEEVPFGYEKNKTASIKISQSSAGKKISQVIWDEAQEHQINPQVFLTTIQKEHSALTSENMPNKWAHAWLLGYGYNDDMANYAYSFDQAKSQAIKYGGISNQIEGAFFGLQNNFLKGLGPKINGITYKVGDKVILSNASGKEPLEVFLSNRATACLYRYTPHVYNGNYNFWKIYQEKFANQTYKLAGL